MAIGSINRLERNASLDVVHYTTASAVPTPPTTNGFYGSVTAAELRIFRALSTLGSTISSGEAGSTTLNIPLEKDSIVAFLVSWGCTDPNAVAGRTSKLVIKAGDERGAWQSDIGDVEVTFMSSGTTGPDLVRKFVGPFEGARFAKVLTSAGSSGVTGVKPGNRFIQIVPSMNTSAGAASYYNVIPFVMPSVQFAT